MKHLDQNFLILIIFLSKLIETEAKYGVIFSETTENCAPPDIDAKTLDLSNFEVVAESDTDFFLNGSAKFLRKIDWSSNVTYHVYTEKFQRGKWLPEVYNAKRPSFCKALQNPMEVWYNKMKTQKGCPFEVGDEWKFDMEPIYDIPVVLTKYLVGRWRATVQQDFYDEEKHEIFCFRIYGEVMEL